jgi:peptidyl-tRNA hydrolase
MKMTIRFALSLAALAAFSTLPIYAQHGHGAGGSSSMGSAHASSHGNSADAKADAKGGSNNSSSSIGEKLTDNTKLAAKLQSLLPAGTNLQTASQGFKNLGQFVAAVHVAHNLGIPFDTLRAKIIGPPKESLGKAIQQLQPTANSKAETKKATDQAKEDMNDSGKSS